jgi:CheY-like chemotaxis protein
MMRGKVIVVEDDAALCYAVARSLQQAGYEVESHLGSTEAWPFVGASAKFDVLLTDLVFPRGQPSGIALARSARYHHPGLAVIFATAYPPAADQAKVEDGIVLLKPVDLDALVRKIDEMLASAPHAPDRQR